MHACTESASADFIPKGSDPYSLQILKVFASAKKFENIKDWSQLH